MRDLTREELEEYFDFARTDNATGEFESPQLDLIMDVLEDSGLVQALFRSYRRVLDVEADEAFIRFVTPMLVWTFQMGRECESRLLTRALKGGRVGNVAES